MWDLWGELDFALQGWCLSGLPSSEVSSSTENKVTSWMTSLVNCLWTPELPDIVDQPQSHLTDWLTDWPQPGEWWDEGSQSFSLDLSPLKKIEIKVKTERMDILFWTYNWPWTTTYPPLFPASSRSPSFLLALLDCVLISHAGFLLRSFSRQCHSNSTIYSSKQDVFWAFYILAVVVLQRR